MASLAARDLHRPDTLLAQVERYWRGLLTQTGSVPRRGDLDASRIASALPHAFILEKVGGSARFRIGGQAIATLLGAELKGVPLSALFTAEARRTIQSWVDRCLSTPALVDLGVVGTQKTLRGRLLLLPLSDSEGEVTRVLGGLLLDGAGGHGPIRFDLSTDASRCEPIASSVQRRFKFASEGGSQGFQETERPYLRLVVSRA